MTYNSIIHIKIEGNDFSLDYRDEHGYYYSDDSSDSDLKRSRSRKVTTEHSRPVRKPATPIEKRIKKNKRKKQRRNILRKVTIFILLACIITVIMGSGLFIGMYKAVKEEYATYYATPVHNLLYAGNNSNNASGDSSSSHVYNSSASHIYYTTQKGDVKELDTLSSPENILWVKFEDISPHMKNAIVAIEDERFYEHSGIDFKRTIGATFKFVLSKIGIGNASYGGSTLTQQVVKNITQEKDKTSTRKLKEMLRAIVFEQNLTKEEILTIYLNIVYFANSCNGVESAANKYFNKSAADLNIAESATIAGITKHPSKYDPYKNPEETLNRRNTVLGKMLELGMISNEEYEEAKSSDLNVVHNDSKKSDKINSYFVDQLVYDIINDLKSQYGYTDEFAKQQLYNGGLKIYATIDPEIQDIMEGVYENTSNFPNSSIQSAMTIIDPYTGEIKGMVGGTGKKTENLIWNRAVQAKRQPGSAIKPLSAYAPALEEGKINAATILEDKKITVGSDNWSPSNSYSGFKGKMLPLEAVGRSVNTIPVQLIEQLGIGTSYNYLSDKFHLSGLEDRDKNYSSLALGGLTQGASTTEMAAAYGTFVNSGKYITPHTYTKVVDSSGKVILENKPETSQAISAETAYIMADLLSAPVNESYGTAQRAKLSGIDTYGKTGTTNDNYDKWFVGFTPYYVGAVWTGYDSPKAINSSSNPSTAVWKTIMEKVHKKLPDTDDELDEPSDIVDVEICTATGKLAKSSCDSVTAYFKPGDQPVQFCRGHYIFRPNRDDEDDEDDDNNNDDDDNNDDENDDNSGDRDDSPSHGNSPSPSRSPSTPRPMTTTGPIVSQKPED